MPEPTGTHTKTDLPECAPLFYYEMPPDPLLQSANFIYTNDDCQHTDRNSAAGQSEPSRTEPPALGSDSSTASRKETRVTPDGTTIADATPTKTRGAQEPVAGKRPDWLPEGWQVEVRTRSSGQTAGSTDRYYVEPVAGRKFRSKNEVLNFLETGNSRKRKSNATPSEGSGDYRGKKSGSKVKKPTKFFFNLENAPQKVSWVRTNASKEIWTPVVGDIAVPERTQWQWAAVFSHISQLKKSTAPK